MHVPAPNISEYEPTLHNLQLYPVSLYLPTSQLPPQSFELNGDIFELIFPGGHKLHSDEPFVEYLPNSQVIQLVAPFFEYFPASQSVQIEDVAPPVLKEPGSQKPSQCADVDPPYII